jgi:hypothetical protein
MTLPRSYLSAAVVGLLFVVAVPRSAQAQGDFQRHLTAAIRLYKNLEYERALTQINLAKQLPHGPEAELELSLYEGIVQAELGQQDASIAAFKSALFVQPEAKLPVKVAPKIANLFESVRTQVQRELAAMPPKSAPQPPKPEVATSPPPAATPPSVAGSRQAPDRTVLRRHALIPAIAGGALVVGGGVSWALSRSQLSRLRGNDPAIQSQEAVQQVVSRGNTLQTLGVTLLGVGAAGLAAAGGMYLLGAPEAPVAVGLSTDGTSAVVYGRWP